MRDLFGLNSKVVVISGGASGIGLATARLLDSLGAKLVLLDVNRAALENVALSSAELVPLDVCDPSACKAVAEKFPQIGALITCAGVALPDDPAGPGVNYERMMDVNVRGTLNLVFACKQGLIADRGRVVMVSSIVANHGWAHRTSYCASKGAVNAAMRALAMELGPHGVAVNAVAPGLVWTPLMQEIVQRNSDPKQAFRFRSAQQVSGRMLRPEEVAEKILFLASALSTGVTASVLDCSGGRLGGHVPNLQNPGPEFAVAYEEFQR